MKRLFITIITISVVAINALAKENNVDFMISKGGEVSISMPKSYRPVVGSALQMFKGDIADVLGASVKTVKKAAKANIVCSIDNSLPREGFSIKVDAGKLYIAGADDHGLAYGLLEISRIMGVSPWVYFADCTPKKLDKFTLPVGIVKKESPAVAYRGIFINDEDWGLNPWATKQEPESYTIQKGRIKGTVGPKVNEKVFQLLLRLRANYYWPAMHECTQPFYLTPGNREMAAKYGIYMGGSHCEPMACSAAGEWSLRGKGDYNYVHNRDAVKAFWQDRLDSVKSQEIVYTLGMRGVHDGSMQGVKTPADKLKYLQMVIDDQRAMLSNTVNKDVESIPQVFVPYKEVLEVYRSGLKVPDDVTLMWTDDNYGYLRHFPDSVESARRGGNGVYYHISYWGRPHDYIWLATLSPYLLYQQMEEGYKRGIKNMWILNVGDIKPGEYSTEEFLDMAWYGPKVNGESSLNPQQASLNQTVHQHMLSFYEREFGKSVAGDITNVMDEYYDLAMERKPEHIAGTRIEEKDKVYWSKIRPIEYWNKDDVDQRVSRYKKISDETENLWAKIPADKRDAFFELVKYPVQGAAQMNFKFLVPEKCEEAYDSIQSLTYIYNKVIANGKWDTMMASKPRYQHVFDSISAADVPVYTDSVFAYYKSETEELNRNINPWSEIAESQDFHFGNTIDADSVTLEVRLLPSYPVGKEYKLAFSVQLDNGETLTREYQTYDREEEWRLNVLRNYALRTFRLPLDKSQATHTIHFTPLTPGVVLQKLVLKH